MEAFVEDWGQDSLDITILLAGRRDLGKWWRYDFTEGIAPWRLYLNDRPGAQLEFLDGTCFEIPASTVVLLPAGLRFQTRAWSPVRHFYVHFHLAGFARLPDRIATKPILVPESSLLRSMIAEASADLVAGSPRLELQWRLKAIVLQALARSLGTSQGEEALPDSAATYGVLRNALRYIQEHHTVPIDNEMLADRCGMSVDHFIRRFRDKVGETPRQHLLTYRARAAAQRLVAGDQTLDTIASECGFASRSHLTRVFHGRYGVTPSEYRRRGQAAAMAELSALSAD
jgi:AraC-like DNA-binding protein